MSQQFHFISGLPRSGSTLLGALLAQNPAFHAGMTSGLGALVSANLNIMSSGSEVSMTMEESQRPIILKSLFESFYHSQKDKKVIFDTNRQWCAKMPLLSELHPGSKVIACVRDVSWILDSIERLYRRNPFENTRLWGQDSDRATVYARVEALARHDRMVGFPWTALKEAFYGEYAENLLIVEYETLARMPEQVLKLVYEFIDEPWYENHDFEHVEFDAPDFDASLGVKGLHKVAPKVEFKSRRSVLPPDLFAQYNEMSFWRNQRGSAARVITVKKEEKEEI